MNRHRPITAIAVLLATAALVGACGSSTGLLGSVPPASSAPEPSVAQGSPDVTPSDEPTTEPSTAPTGSIPPDSTAAPTPVPSGTTIVRAYFWLGGPEGSAGLVATLREVSGTKAVATAAVNALLAGPSASEGSRSITSAIPDGSQLLGITIADSVATVNLSKEFESGGGSASVTTGSASWSTRSPSSRRSRRSSSRSRARPGPCSAARAWSSTSPSTRADYVNLLPDIWVDRPAFNAAIGNPAKVTGNANVFEAAFRIAILDASGKTIADQQVMATCGTGCRGTFDVTIPYTVSKGQYGILRAYNLSAMDGSPESIRDYRVWLTPKG